MKASRTVLKRVQGRNPLFLSDLPLTGLETIQGLMFMIASAYNAIRIYNITKEKGLNLYEVIKFIRLIGLRIIN